MGSPSSFVVCFLCVARLARLWGVAFVSIRRGFVLDGLELWRVSERVGTKHYKIQVSVRISNHVFGTFFAKFHRFHAKFHRFHQILVIFRNNFVFRTFSSNASLGVVRLRRGWLARLPHRNI